MDWSRTVNWTGHFEVSLGWLCLLPVVFLVALIVFVTSAHSKRRLLAEADSDLKLESDLQLARSRPPQSQSSPTWTPPKLPPSVIASIWTGRLIRTAAHIGGGSEPDPTSSILLMTWDFRQKAAYVVAAALLGLRDAGLIRMFVEPPSKLLHRYKSVKVERTDLALPSVDMPPIEGGLLIACLDIAHKRFGKTTQPAAYSVVSEWIHESMGRPFKWVLDVAAQQGRELGLYEPAIKKSGLGKIFGSTPPVFSLDHLAACDDQVVAYVARWQEIALAEPQLQGALLIEVAFGIYARQQSGG